MEQLLLHNLRIIDPFGEREFLEHASILIENETIKFVGRGFSHVGFDGQILDMQGKTVLPGIINAHTHLYLPIIMHHSIAFVEPVFFQSFLFPGSQLQQE